MPRPVPSNATFDPFSLEPGKWVWVYWPEPMGTSRAQVAESRGHEVELVLSLGRDAFSECPETGAPVELWYEDDGTGYVVRATLLWWEGEGRIGLGLSSDGIQAVQRRDHFREDVRGSLEVSFERRASPTDGTPSPLGAGGAVDTSTFEIRNLSGGGCLAHGSDPRLRPGWVYRGHLRLRKTELPVAVKLRVVRQDLRTGVPQVAFVFDELSEKVRRRIVRFLLQAYRSRVRQDKAGAGIHGTKAPESSAGPA